MCEVFTNILASGQAGIPGFLQANDQHRLGMQPGRLRSGRDWSASVSLAEVEGSSARIVRQMAREDELWLTNLN